MRETNLTMKLVSILILSFLILGCSSDSEENSRTYIEGKISTTIPIHEVILKLKSNDKTLGETTPESTGAFVLSAPIEGNNLYLETNFKIKKIQVENHPNLVISKDSMQILIPASTTFLRFTEIQLTK